MTGPCYACYCTQRRLAWPGINVNRERTFSTTICSTPVRLPAASAGLVPGAVVLVALALYLPTLAPSITWRNGGADSGDFATAVLTRGVPHPPGYPTYVLLALVWTALPLPGDVALRLNLLSAGGAAVAAGLSAATVVVLGRRAGLGGAGLGAAALLAGLALAASPLLWSQATIAEVYASGLAALALFGLLTLSWEPAPRLRDVLPAVLVGGLGLGVLPQIGLAAPGALGLLVARAGWRALSLQWLAAILAAGALGLGTFAYLPLRAAAHPAVVWGEPTSLAGFWEVVSAAWYKVYFLAGLDAAGWLARVGASLAIVGENVSGPGLILAVLGAAVLWRCDRAALGYLLSLAILTVLFRASYLAEGNVVYLLPAVYVGLLLAGLGAAWLLAAAGERGRRWPVALTVVLALLLAWRTVLVAPEIDASNDWTAVDISERLLRAMPEGAILVSDYDETTFALWYLQALGRRPDVVVVDARLIFRDWYQRQLVQRYPDLNPAAVTPSGLTALGRPIYRIVGGPERAVPRPVVPVPEPPAG